MPDLLGIGTLWITIIAILPIVIIILVAYSIWTLRKDENWEQR